MPDDRDSTTIYNFPSLVRDSYGSHLFLRYPERFQLRAVHRGQVALDLSIRFFQRIHPNGALTIQQQIPYCAFDNVGLELIKCRH